MKVEVQLFATFGVYLPAGSTSGVATIDVADGSTVADVAAQLGIPAALPRLALVNGQDADSARRLTPNDVVTLFPPLVGG